MDQNTKISDSAYSNSCSNSQSRTSGSSKSRHSNSSGSSGYGRSISNNDPQNLLKRTKDKDRKMKKLKNIIQTQTSTAADSTEQGHHSKSEQNSNNDAITSDADKVADNIESKQNLEDAQKGAPAAPTANKSTNDEEHTAECQEHNANVSTGDQQETNAEIQQQQQQVKAEKSSGEEQGFCCVISMHDGVVQYTTPSITNSLGDFRNILELFELFD